MTNQNIRIQNALQCKIRLGTSRIVGYDGKCEQRGRIKIMIEIIKHTSRYEGRQSRQQKSNIVLKVVYR